MKNNYPKGSCLQPLLLLLISTLTFSTAQAQVGVGTSTPSPAAALDISSTTKGLLPPRLSTTERDALTTAQSLGLAQAGLLIFNTTTGVLNQWNGTAWVASLVSTAAPTTFSYSGSPQTYTVPAGVTQLRVVATGGAGGPYNTPAALGGRVQATIPVTPGEVLTIVIGGQGGSGAASNPGGYNGGGTGNGNAGGGGGATELQRAIANGATGDYLSSRNALVVAGGGGGGDNTVMGGAGGTPNGATGGFFGDCTPGQGATQVAAGGGGVPGSNNIGGNGTLTGGGGGGYYGGGGGTGVATGAAGGGGGSSWAVATATNVTYSLAPSVGNGSITLSPALADQDASAVTGTLPTTSPWLQNGASLYPADQNAYIGIGTSAPLSRFQVINNGGGGGAADDYLFDEYGPGDQGIYLRKSNGTITAPANLANGDFIGRLAFTPRYGGSIGYTSGSILQSSYRGDGTNNLTDLQLWTSATERLRISETGNVGIATTTPLAKLDILGGADNNGGNDPQALAFQWHGSGYRHWIRTRHNSGLGVGGNAIDFYVNNSGTAAGSSTPTTGTLHVLTLDNYGSPRVGIGTTAPYSMLANTASNIIGTDGNGGNPGSLAWSATQQGYAAMIYNGGTGTVGNGLSVKINGTGANATALEVSKGAQTAIGTPLLSVRGSGNVGIGTNGPSRRLTVGDAGATDGSAHALLSAGFGSLSYLRHARLMFNDKNFGVGAGHFSASPVFDDDLYFYAYNGTGRDIRFMHTTDGDTDPSSAAWSTDMIVKAGGFVGLGTPDPVSQLANTSINILGSDVQGGNPGSLAWSATQTGYAAMIYNGGTASNSNGLAVKIDGTNPAALALDVSKGAQAAGGTTLLAVKSSGSVGIGTNNPGQLLDVRGNIAATGPLGVILNSQDRPLITRGFDAFATGNYAGIGRWGVFMEPNNLTFGVPNLTGKQFQWATYADNSTVAQTLMALTQEDFLGIGTAAPFGKLHVVTDASTGGREDDYLFDDYGTRSNGIFLRGSRGTVAAPVVLQDGDQMGSLVFTPRYGAGAGSLGYLGSGLYGFYRGDGTNLLTDLRFHTSAAERLRIDEAGRVSIGGVQSTYRTGIYAGSTTENGLFVQLNGASAAQSMKLEHNGSNFIVRPLAASSNSTVVENTGGGSLLLNPAGGSVGVGTTSPDARLDVEAGSGAVALKVSSGTAALSTASSAAPTNPLNITLTVTAIIHKITDNSTNNGTLTLGTAGAVDGQTLIIVNLDPQILTVAGYTTLGVPSGRAVRFIYLSGTGWVAEL